MFKRPHHQRIARLLAALDVDVLGRAQCFFGGGTAIVLMLGEYRESVDADFLCSSQDGYRLLREAVFHRGLGGLFREPVKELRELRADQYGIRTFVEVDGAPIKLELVREARIALEGATDPALKVPTLSQSDLYAEKLLANADRGGGRATFDRDLVDLSMMIASWGPIPASAWQKVRAAYGDTAEQALVRGAARLRDATWMRECMNALQMEQTESLRILSALSSTVSA
jgi:hypothetical protein